MRILYYNWCPLQESEGGGIAVYQRALLQYYEIHKIAETFFLCSGFYYDGKKLPYIREEKPQYSTRVFSLVNSPVYAPMRAPEKNFSAMLEDETCNRLITDFLNRYGPFDVIHFQTMEGLPLKALNVIPAQTRCFYSVHNYTALCPNVMLWTEDRTNCEVEPGDCNKCMARYNRPCLWILKNSRRLLEKKHERLYYLTRGVKYISRKYFPLRKGNDSEVYKRYIQESIDLLNTQVTGIFAVSERVKSILDRHGVRNVSVLYIGTRHAEKALGCSLTIPEQMPFGIVYMGYMREEKGFYFFLDALEGLSKDLSSNMMVTFATRITDSRATKRIDALKERYKDIRVFDGYSYEDLPEILKGAHLGVVPVLWEDNLPQVAIEMIALGVPVLSSSYGGASELNGCEAFRFIGGDTKDFLDKLETIYSNRDLLKKYWNEQKVLTTMEKHVEELMEYYRGLPG